MLTIEYTGQFKRDYRQALKRGFKAQLLKEVVSILVQGQDLPPKYRGHNLSGKHQNMRERHILPDGF